MLRLIIVHVLIFTGIAGVGVTVSLLHALLTRANSSRLDKFHDAGLSYYGRKLRDLSRYPTLQEIEK